MNIFLDTNVIYTDPFFLRGKNAVLRRLAMHEDVKLFVNQTVYSEVFRGHKTFVEKQVKAAEEALSKLMPYLNKERETLDVKIDQEDLLEDLKDHFTRLEEDGQLVIVPYDIDVLQNIVEVDMHEKAPFIKKEQLTNKGGQKVTYIRKEMRDAIIWYSYQQYIEKNDLEECYFISNNTREFGDVNANQTPDGEPYPLHPEIAENSKLIAYQKPKDFLMHNGEQIKELFKDTSYHTKLLTEELAEHVEQELNEGLAAELIREHLKEEIIQQTENYLADKMPVDIHRDYFMGGYIYPSFLSDVNDIKFQEVDVYGKVITVSVTLEMDVDVDIYLYNPIREGGDDKHEYCATDVLKVEEMVTFLLPLNTDKELDSDNFSLREYIEGIEPSNVDVEIIALETVEHASMFEKEEDYDEDYVR
ncbi:uncharacterized protein DUF4935 [Bacillus sp. AG236]|nr:uncharacterized protein DUF4935 [Bacillus sp. AG236]